MDLETTRYETAEQLELLLLPRRVSRWTLEHRNLRLPESQVPRLRHRPRQALQLTNILRDVQNDAQRERIYLPLAELRKFSVSETEILAGQYSDRYARLARNIAERARHYYQKARQTLPAEDRRAMVAAEMMGSVYWRLLLKLERQNFHVFQPTPVRLSKPRKLGLILRSPTRQLIRALTLRLRWLNQSDSRSTCTTTKPTIPAVPRIVLEDVNKTFPLRRARPRGGGRRVAHRDRS